MASVDLSILIPSIPDRMTQLHGLLTLYQSYIDKFNLKERIELLCFVDNKKRSIGRKRSDLITMSEGRYVVISDDDDRLTEKYFEVIMQAIQDGADVITYWQFARINHEYYFIDFGLGNELQPTTNLGIIKRPAWHCCTWKREVVKDIKFPEINWGEDGPWSGAANKAAKSEFKINEICHIYSHDSHLTSAFL